MWRTGAELAAVARTLDQPAGVADDVLRQRYAVALRRHADRQHDQIVRCLGRGRCIDCRGVRPAARRAPPSAI
jgi:hypothetical protein